MSYKVVVRTLTGNDYTVEVTKDMRISTFKIMIHRATRIPPRKQRVVYNGMLLYDDDKTVGSYVGGNGIFYLTLILNHCNCGQLNVGRLFRYPRIKPRKNHIWKESFDNMMIKSLGINRSIWNSFKPCKKAQDILEKVEDLMKHRHPGLVSFEPVYYGKKEFRKLSLEDFLIWNFTIRGGKKTCFSEGLFRFQIDFSESPPRFRFKTPIFHPMYDLYIRRYEMLSKKYPEKCCVNCMKKYSICLTRIGLQYFYSYMNGISRSVTYKHHTESVVLYLLNNNYRRFSEIGKEWTRKYAGEEEFVDDEVERREFLVDNFLENFSVAILKTNNTIRVGKFLLE